MGSQGVGHDWATELHWTSVSWSFTYASALLGMVLVLVVRTPIALPVPAPACGVGSPRSPPPPVFLEACGTSDGTLPSFPVSLPAPCWCPLPWGHWGAVSPLSHCQSCSLGAWRHREEPLLCQFFTLVSKWHGLYHRALPSLPAGFCPQAQKWVCRV